MRPYWHFRSLPFRKWYWQRHAHRNGLYATNLGRRVRMLLTGFRVAVIEAAIAELSEGHRGALEERDREVTVLEKRCNRLTAALHRMVDLLGAEQVRPIGTE